MKKTPLIFAILVLLVSCKSKTNDTVTVSHEWEQLKNFPLNGNAQSMIFLGNNMVVADIGNVYDMTPGTFTSPDGGNTWSAKNRVLKSQIRSFCTDGSNLYVAVMDSGVMMSSDLGNTWIKKCYGLPDLFRPMQMTEYEDRFYACGIGGTFSSDPHNINWTGITSTTSFTIVKKGNVLISSEITGNYRSDDNGVTWIRIEQSSGLKDASMKIFAIVNDNILATPDSPNIVYISGDNGMSWIQSSGLDDAGSNFIYCFQVYGGNVYAATSNGVYKSSDNGLTWKNTGCPNALSLAIKGSVLYAGTGYHGIWKINL